MLNDCLEIYQISQFIHKITYVNVTTITPKVHNGRFVHN
jgi:hypothetical protein